MFLIWQLVTFLYISAAYVILYINAHILMLYPFIINFPLVRFFAYVNLVVFVCLMYYRWPDIPKSSLFRVNSSPLIEFSFNLRSPHPKHNKNEHGTPVFSLELWIIEDKFVGIIILQVFWFFLRWLWLKCNLKVYNNTTFTISTNIYPCGFNEYSQLKIFILKVNLQLWQIKQFANVL